MPRKPCTHHTGDRITADQWLVILMICQTAAIVALT